MILLSQGFAVLVAGALLSWRARVRGPSFGIRPAAVAVVVAILTFVSLASFWSAWQGLRKEREGNAPITAADAGNRGGAAAGANVAFVDWVSGQLPGGVPFEVSTTGSDSATYQWLTYRLYPRVASPRAHWVVFVKTTPAAAGFKRGELSRVVSFAPDFALAERRE